MTLTCVVGCVCVGVRSPGDMTGSSGGEVDGGDKKAEPRYNCRSSGFSNQNGQSSSFAEPFVLSEAKK